MKIKYSIDKNLHIVIVDYLEDPHYLEWIGIMQEIIRHPDFVPGSSIILDRHRVHTAPSTDYIKAVVEFIKAHPSELGKTHWATITTDIASYGMMRMAQEMGGNAIQNMAAFLDLDSAKRWLLQGEQTKEP